MKQFGFGILQMTIASNLVTKHALQIMHRHVPDLAYCLEEFKKETSHYAVYPDGSLLIEGERCFDLFWDFAVARGLFGLGMWQPKSFCGLPEFGEKHCSVWYTEDYREILGEDDLRISFPDKGYPETNYHLRDLAISVVFKRKCSEQVRQRFAQWIGEWEQQVVTKGISGEGPIRLASPGIGYQGRLAQLRVDVSQSGQATLNWLLLSVLDFGYSVSPVTNFVFAHEENIVLLVEGLRGNLESVFGPLVTVSIRKPAV